MKLPDGLAYDDACFVTVGAIAMHGTRLARIELGEVVVVMGLGLVGQIAAQLARCAGATVVATDLDPTKVALATELGAHHAIATSDELTAAVAALTNGQGADAVLICAAAKSDEPIRQAASLARLKGRVVVVGDVGMQLERRPFFEKEISLVVSRSYGPGRYDPAYEERGVDYPLPYVRWTEGRNMASFLDLQARQAVRVAPLVTHRFPIDEAEVAYEIVIGKRKEAAIAIVLEYSEAATAATRVEVQPRHAVPSIGRCGSASLARDSSRKASCCRRSRVRRICNAAACARSPVSPARPSPNVTARHTAPVIRPIS